MLTVTDLGRIGLVEAEGAIEPLLGERLASASLESLDKALQEIERNVRALGEETHE